MYSKYLVSSPGSTWPLSHGVPSDVWVFCLKGFYAALHPRLRTCGGGAGRGAVRLPSCWNSQSSRFLLLKVTLPWTVIGPDDLIGVRGAGVPFSIFGMFTASMWVRTASPLLPRSTISCQPCQRCIDRSRGCLRCVQLAPRVIVDTTPPHSTPQPTRSVTEDHCRISWLKSSNKA